MRNERDMRFDPTSGAWFGKSRPVSPEEMAARVWRFGELVPSPRAFLDCTLPGHVRTLLSALGGGADDEQLEGTAVEQAVSYHIDFVKAPAGQRRGPPQPRLRGDLRRPHRPLGDLLGRRRQKAPWSSSPSTASSCRTASSAASATCADSRGAPPHHSRRPQRRPLRLVRSPSSPPSPTPHGSDGRLSAVPHGGRTDRRSQATSRAWTALEARALAVPFPRSISLEAGTTRQSVGDSAG